MKSRYQWTSTITAILVIYSLQIPSSAQLPTSLSRASGMTKAQIQKVYGDLDKAITQISAALSKASKAGKEKVTDTTLTHTGTLSIGDRYTCAKGGYIASTMSSTDVLTKSTGLIAMTVTIRQTSSNWQCIAGWKVNGSLSLNYKVSASTTSEITGVNGTTIGTWKSTGPKNIKQSCQIRGTLQEANIGANPTITLRVTCTPGGVTVITAEL